MTYGDLIEVLLGLMFVIFSARSSSRYVRRANDHSRAVLTCIGSGVLLVLLAWIVPDGTMPGSVAIGLFIGSVLGMSSPGSGSPRAEIEKGAILRERNEALEDPSDEPPKLQSNAVAFTVLYPGQFFLVDTQIRVAFGGQPLGVGSVKRGLALAGNSTVSVHDLEVRTAFRTRRYRIQFPQSGAYEVRLTYSRTWGNFSNAADVRRVRNAAKGKRKNNFRLSGGSEGVVPLG